MKTPKHFPVTDRKPQEIIAFHNGRSIDVAYFLAQARALSRKLPKHQYVFNLLSDRYHYLLVFCASVIAGQCTLMPPNRLTKTLEELAAEYPDCYTLCDNDLLEDNGYRDVFEDSYVPGSSDGETPLIPANQLCAVAFTSGSTGKPTPNLKFWSALRISSIANAELLLEEASGRLNLLATVPAQHMWGFETSILMPLFANVAVSQLSPFYPQDISEALELLAEPRALVSSPVHLNVLLKSGVELVKLDRIYTATAPMSNDLALQLEKRFNTHVIDIFGSSESGIIARRNAATETLWHLSGLFDLEVRKDGFLIKGHHLPEDVVIPDIIEKVGNSRFRWLGRNQDMINVAGKRGSLIDLNRRLLAIDGVVDGMIFMPGSGTVRLAALVVAPTLEPADILRVLELEIEPIFLPRPVYMVPRLPRQETGKLANKEVLKLFADTMKRKGARLHGPKAG